VRVAAAVAAVLLYLCLGTIVLHEAIIGGETLAASGTLARIGPYEAALRAEAPASKEFLIDSARCFVPWLRQAADHFAATGTLPLWRNTALCGAPQVGNPQSALFFPPNLLALMLGLPDWSHAWLSLFKLVVASFCAYLLARYLRLSYVASLAVGVVYGFAGFNLVWMMHPHSAVTCVLPLVVMATDMVARAPTGRNIALLAFAAAIQHYAGYPEVTLLCQGFAFLLGVIRVLSMNRATGLARILGRIGLLVVGYVLGALLSAHLLLSFIEYMMNSQASGASNKFWVRGGALDYHAATHVSAALFGIACVVAALAFRRLASTLGNPAGAFVIALLSAAGALLAACYVPGFTDRFAMFLASDWFGSPSQALDQKINYVEPNAVFLGCALPIAILGSLSGGRGQNPWIRRICVVSIAVGGLLAFRAPILTEVLASFPLMRLAGTGRAGVIAVLGAAVLTGYGIDAVSSRGRSPRLARRFTLAVTAVTGAIFLAHVSSLLLDAQRMRPPSGVPMARIELNVVAVEFKKPVRAVCCEGFVSGQERMRFLHVDGGPDRKWGATIIDVPDEWTAGRVAREYEVQTGFRVLLPASEFGVGEDDVEDIKSRIVMLGRNQRDDLFSSDFDAAVSNASVWNRKAMLPANRQANVQLLLLVLTTVGITFMLARPTPVPGSGLVLVGVLAVSLMHFASGYAPTLPRKLFFPESPLIGFLRSVGSNGRVCFVTPRAMQPEVPCYYGIRIVRGADGLIPRRIGELLSTALSVHSPAAPSARLLGVMGAQYLVNFPGPTDEFERIEFEDRESVRGYDVTANPHFLPRARLVSGSLVTSDPDAAIDALLDPDVSLEDSVILEHGESRKASKSPAGTAVIEVDEASRVVVRVNPTCDSFLVLSDTFFPGWRAYVDGSHGSGRREILRANHAFRAVAVSPGDEVVHFLYKPAGFRWGLVLTALAAVGFLGLLLLGRERGPSGATPGPG